ncbi:hypothetical protein JMN32_17845 [Fulvivirga sp. 29W222]|uniref:SHOCT domain-containing protein n=1 Tax=Fulvivirga marina TaxID=2494733 RepID=A0A937KD36_9BACT|nr:hypothetical protein [Fulvivirga marina]MBL6448187.1 hypothetical protein [Fulvivirga marina]
MKKVILFSSVFMLFHFAVIAQTSTGRVNNRQMVQQTRIAEGRASGELTRGEVRTLKAEQRHIRKVERRVKADGVVTTEEKLRLHSMQNRANRNIRKQKNDSQGRLD